MNGRHTDDERKNPRKTLEARAKDLVLDGDVEPGVARGTLVFVALLSSLTLGLALGSMLGVWFDAWRLPAVVAAGLVLFAAMRLLRALKDAEHACAACVHPAHFAGDCPSLHCICPEGGAAPYCGAVHVSNAVPRADCRDVAPHWHRDDTGDKVYVEAS